MNNTRGLFHRFSRFLNCKNSTKLRKAYYIVTGEWGRMNYSIHQVRFPDKERNFVKTKQFQRLEKTSLKPVTTHKSVKSQEG